MRDDQIAVDASNWQPPCPCITFSRTDFRIHRVGRLQHENWLKEVRNVPRGAVAAVVRKGAMFATGFQQSKVDWMSF